MRSNADIAWLESLSPWPEEFGLGRMVELLARLGEPQRRFPAIHVVGTNGKTTTVRTAEALLDAAGLRVGAYTSPHVVSWAERIRVGGEEVDLGTALARVRPAAEAVGATQFEALTATAFAEFAEAGVDAAVVEAGSNIPTCSARRARRSPRRSSPSCRPAARSCSASPSGRRLRAGRAPRR